MMNKEKEDNICWYHSNITREEAENLLQGGPDGLFLVRTSNSSAGDFVLSVFHNNEVTHFQIRRHTEDVFFSIQETIKFHGLEVLVEHYSNNPLNGELKLTDYIKGEVPPPETRRFGKSNLLHRATDSGNHSIVLEVLKSGKSHEAKNQDGQTAVHIAAISGRNEILQTLIEFGANVNLRDKAGLTPLHYACQNGFDSTARLLVQVGGANIQARNTTNDLVPLHEAASGGFTEVVKVLLSLNAPVKPRDKFNNTPWDLASRNGHTKCAQILEEYRPPKPKTEKSKWYHGTLDRQEAETLIKQHYYKTGAYLVRFSDRYKEMVLTLLNDNSFYNYIIRQENRYLYIDDGPYLESLEHIIDYYSSLADGLPTTLQFAVPPTPKPPVPFATMPRVKTKKADENNQNETNKRIPSHKDITFTCNFKPINNNNNTESKEDTYIPLDSIIRGNRIGEGEFGSVYEGTYTKPTGEIIKVAIKTLRDEQIESNKGAFLSESHVMMKLNHHCVVKLIGLSLGPPLLMVQELVALGSILSYMDNNRDRINPNYEFKLWAAQIACGMKYLEEQRFVHRDLAARNILLATQSQVKISDFGLSRALGNDHEYYRALQGGKWPLKWYAPESFNYGQFSHKSDVWSFGVTIWEMYAFGAPPYGDLKGAEAIQLIEAGERLLKPEQCPDHIYDIMLRCWEYTAEKRPTFVELLEIFSSDTDYMNLKELLPETDLAS